MRTATQSGDGFGRSRSRPSPGPLVTGIVAATCLLITGSGCAGADDPEGVALGALPEWIVASVPAVVIGEDEELPGHLLDEVRDVRLLEDGGLVVLNGGDLEIRVFDSEGRLQRRWGGRGEGPGEFRWIQGMHRVEGDTLIVMSRPRLVWLHPEGGPGRSVEYELPVHSDPCLASEGEVTLLGAQILVGWKEMGLPGCPSTPEGRFRRDTEYWRVHAETGRVDTLGTFAGEERRGLEPLNYFGRRLIAVPIGDSTALGETGGSWIRVVGSGPETVAEWPSPFAPRPLESRELDEWRTVLAERYQATVEVIDGVLRWVPDPLPAFSDLVVDGARRLWVGRFEPFFSGAEQEWVALEGGRAVARLTMPPGVRMLDLRDGVAAGLWYDELGVERVGLFPVKAP